jgi:hypothetical protein
VTIRPRDRGETKGGQTPARSRIQGHESHLFKADLGERSRALIFLPDDSLT